MSMQNRRGAISVGALVLIVGAVVVGCAGGESAPSVPKRLAATVGPEAIQDGFTGTIDEATRAQILTYAHALHFDGSDGASDMQRLRIVDSSGAHYGPRVRIEPEVGVVRLTRAQLRRGRIVARMVNYDTIPYPKLGIPAHGAAYFWMDSTAKGHWRAVYIPDDTTHALVERETGTRTLKSAGDSLVHVRDSVIVHVNPDSIFRSRARWLWSDADEGTWASCTMTGCCFSNSKQFTP